MLSACSLGSPGLDEIRWKAPVRPGDTLRVVAEVLQARPSLNQRGEAVTTLIGNQLCRRRPPGQGRVAP